MHWVPIGVEELEVAGGDKPWGFHRIPFKQNLNFLSFPTVYLLGLPEATSVRSSLKILQEKQSQ